MTATLQETASLVLEFSGGPYDGRRLAVAADVLRIGSDPQCAVRLRGEAAPPVWCELRRSGDDVVLSAQGPTVRVNGDPTETREIGPGDVVEAGPLRFRVVAPPRSAEQSAAPDADVAAPLPAQSDSPPPEQSVADEAPPTEEAEDQSELLHNQAELLNDQAKLLHEQADLLHDSASPGDEGDGEFSEGGLLSTAEVRRISTQRTRRLVAKLRDLASEFTQEKSRGDALQEDLQAVREELSSAKAHATAAERQIEEIRRQLQEQVDSLQEKLGESETGRQTMLQELDGLRDSLQQTRREEDGESARVAELERQLAEAHGERERLLHQLQVQESSADSELDEEFAGSEDASSDEPAAATAFLDEKFRSAVAGLRSLRDSFRGDEEQPADVYEEEGAVEGEFDPQATTFLGGDEPAGEYGGATESYVESSYEEPAESGLSAPGTEQALGDEPEPTLNLSVDEYQGTVAWNGGFDDAESVTEYSPEIEATADSAGESVERTETQFGGRTAEFTQTAEAEAVATELPPEPTEAAEFAVEEAAEATQRSRSWLDQIDGDAEAGEAEDETEQANEYQATSVLETLKKLQFGIPEDSEAEAGEEIVQERYETEGDADSGGLLSPEVEASVAEAAPEEAEANEADDVSIEDYMQRLIARNGGSPAAAAPSATSTAPAPAIEKPKPKPKPARPRRRAAPEATSDLAAMRQLANSTAKSAVASHALKMAKMHVGSKCVVALFCIGIGIALLAIADGILAIVGATAAFGMAIYTGYDIFRVWFRLQQIQHSGPKQGSKGRQKAPRAASPKTKKAAPRKAKKRADD